MAYLRGAVEGTIVNVRLQPRSSANSIAGVVDDCLRMRVTAPPVEGAANEACREVLSKALGIGKGRIEILAGTKSRTKRVLLRNVDEETASELVARALTKSRPKR